MTHYIRTEELVAANEEVVEATGGSTGVREPTMLESIVVKPRATFGGEDLYPDLYLKAAVLFEAIINYHAFVDGNKRTALAVLIEFLFRNDHRFTPDDAELERFTLLVATTNPDLADVAVWIKQHARPVK